MLKRDEMASVTPVSCYYVDKILTNPNMPYWIIMHKESLCDCILNYYVKILDKMEIFILKEEFYMVSSNGTVRRTYRW